jgi:hypothetical protein
MTPYQQSLLALANRLPALRAQGTPLSRDMALVELDLRTLVQQECLPRPDQVDALLNQVRALRRQGTSLSSELALLEVDLQELETSPGTSEGIERMVSKARRRGKRLALLNGYLMQAIQAQDHIDKIGSLMRSRDAALWRFDDCLNDILLETTTHKRNAPNALLEGERDQAETGDSHHAPR